MSCETPIPIEGPPPVPRPFSLLTVASQIPNDDNERWANGVVPESFPTDTPIGWDPSSTGSSRVKQTGATIPLPTFASWVAYTPITCTRRGVWSDEDMRRKAQAVLEATDAYALERELVAGTMTGNASLADGTMAGANILGTALEAMEGLARLEDAAAALTGRQAVIHAPPSLITAWGFDRLRVVGDRLFTAAGTPVISGGGYVDQKPAAGGALGATKQWAYATGPILYGRGRVDVRPETAGQATDLQDNTTTYRAERNLLVLWDTVLQVGVEIDRSA